MSEETITPIAHDFTWLIATVYRAAKNSADQQWIAAFAEYNEDHKTERPLQPTCAPCYAKVLIYLRQKHGR